MRFEPVGKTLKNDDKVKAHWEPLRPAEKGVLRKKADTFDDSPFDNGLDVLPEETFETNFDLQPPSVNLPEGTKAEQELELWRRWKKNGDQEALRELLKRLQPLINSVVNTYRTAPIPLEALKGKAMALTMQALNSYDESKNTQISTYVMWYLKKMYRFVTAHQNVARIPEAKSMEIGTFQDAKQRLQERLGREPTMSELATELKWPLSKVRDLSKRLRKDLIYAPTELSEESTYGAPFEIQLSAFEFPTMIDLFYQEELTPEEQRFFELYSGWKTGKRLSIEETARQMGIPFNHARVIKSHIDKKLKKFFS